MLRNISKPVSFVFLFYTVSASLLFAEDQSIQFGSEVIYPQKLKKGDTIQIVAPAGIVDRERIELAIERLKKRGYKVIMREDAFDQFGYLAGDDERRADELMQAFLDPEVKAVFPARGGYGTMRMMEALDYNLIRKNPKIMIGFSDITGLHLAINRRAGLVTFHSPNPEWGLGSDGNIPEFSGEYFFRAIEQVSGRSDEYVIEIPEGVPQPVAMGTGKARGKIIGGNLSLISALMGTPYEIDTKNSILLIEDTREAPYRVDRMLSQLKLAGKLDTLCGAVLGQFTDSYDREKDQLTDDERFGLNGVLIQYFKPLDIPVLMNYPIGHHEMNATVPLNGQVEIDADNATLKIMSAKSILETH